MEVEMSKARVPETPASVMSEDLVEHITAIMVACGIESISATKYVSGFGSRLHVSMSPFNDAPEDVANQGIIVKDAIAQIMSVANITRIVAKPTRDERRDVISGWSAAVKNARTSNEGSASVAAGSGEA